MTCPKCRGTGSIRAVVTTLRDGTREADFAQTPCSRCGGAGVLTDTQDIHRAVGEALRAARKRRGLTLLQEAARLEMPWQQLAEQERGRELDA